MTINPKVTIGGGVVLAGGGAYMFYQSNKATDKKKKLMYGLAGAGLVVAGFFVGKKGVVQVIGLRAHDKVATKPDEPSKGVIADMNKEKVEEKKPSANSGTKTNGVKVDRSNDDRTVTLAFNDSKKNADSFDTIMHSTGATPQNHAIKTIPTQKPNIVDKNKNIISAHRNDAVRTMGTKVVSKVDPKILERNKIEKQTLLSTISAKETEHKKLIKLSGWHAGLPLRNEISMLKARLHYV
jgi:hypothetical protein